MKAVIVTAVYLWIGVLVARMFLRQANRDGDRPPDYFDALGDGPMVACIVAFWPLVAVGGALAFAVRAGLKK